MRISAYPGAGSPELVEEVVADVPKEIGGFYYSAHSDQLFKAKLPLAETHPFNVGQCAAVLMAEYSRQHGQRALGA